MDISPSYIDSIAPNANTISNGKSLIKKFTNLNITPDNTLLFGECAGSGKNPYSCSMDFIDPASPVPRCSCPSRQIPCKHVIGLLYAYVEGKTFTKSDVPESIITKREGAVKRAENKEKKKQIIDLDAPPSKAKITAAVKRIDMQLEGLAIAGKLLKSITRTGLSGIDARTRDALSGQITQLGNYHIKGIQAAFNELLIYIKAGDEHFPRSIEQLIFIRALVKKACEHLDAKKQADALKLDITSEIEEQIGHIWKLEELRAYGCCIPQAELIQLSFNVHDDPAKREYVDVGYHLCLQDGKVYVTKNYRPYKSMKYINQDNTVFDTVIIDELFFYPGGINRRARYDKFSVRTQTNADYAAIKRFASDDYAETAKSVKNQLKTPLANKNPAAILKVARMYAAQDENGQEYIMAEDSKGTRQLLRGESLPLLTLIDFGLLSEQALLVAYENDVETGLLTAQPLSIIADDRIIRLQY